MFLPVTAPICIMRKRHLGAEAFPGRIIIRPRRVQRVFCLLYIRMGFKGLVDGCLQINRQAFFRKRSRRQQYGKQRT